MPKFRITIEAIGAAGCDRDAKPGERLHGRCGRFRCPDCIAYDMVQQLKQKGVGLAMATFTLDPGGEHEVVDDMLKNQRVSGTFPL